MNAAEHKRALIAQGEAYRSGAVQAREALRENVRASLRLDLLTPQTLQRAGAGVLAGWLGSGALARIGALLPVALRLWPVLARRKRLRQIALAAAVAGAVVYLKRKKD